MNIKYIKTAFSADCSKNFDVKNMVQIMGKICPIYVPYFAHGVFTLKVSERFQFTLQYRSDLTIPQSEVVHFNSHSRTGSDKSIHTKIKLSATQLVFVFLPYKRILAHKRAFFNRNFLYYNKKNKINPVSRIVKNASYAALTGVIL